jgi:hypothetical protein
MNLQNAADIYRFQDGSKEMLGLISLEKFLPAIPVVVTGVALSFDVGYFYGVGIDYYTLFSLSEHIVFALEALPAALILVLIVTFGFIASKPILRLGISRAERTLDTRRSTVDKLNYLRVLRRIALCIAFVINVSILFFLWEFGWYRVLIVFSIATFLSLVLVTSDRSDISVALGSVVLGVCIAILMGEYFGSRYVVLMPAKDILTQGSVSLNVNVIRAGDRGLLYAIPDKHQIGFAQWDTIKGISRRSGDGFFPDLEK